MDKAYMVNFTANFVVIFKNLIVYALIGRVLISWFTMGVRAGRGRFTRFIYDVTDPFIRVARKLPHRLGMIDFAPLIALIGIDLLGQMIVRGLFQLL